MRVIPFDTEFHAEFEFCTPNSIGGQKSIVIEIWSFLYALKKDFFKKDRISMRITPFDAEFHTESEFRIPKSIGG